MTVPKSCTKLTNLPLICCRLTGIRINMIMKQKNQRDIKDTKHLLQTCTNNISTRMAIYTSKNKNLFFHKQCKIFVRHNFA